MRRLELLAFLVALTGPGCSLLTDYRGHTRADGSVASVDAGAAEGGMDASVAPGDAGELDAGPLDASAADAQLRDAELPDAQLPDARLPDAHVPTGCTTDLAVSRTIALGTINQLPSPATNFVFDALGRPDSTLGVGWVSAGGTARFRAWVVDPAAGRADASVPEHEALTGVSTSLGSIRVAWSAATGWLVHGNAGLGYRAATCGATSCTASAGPIGAESPFAFAQSAGDFVLVHTGPGASFSTLWRASTWSAAGSTVDLATAASSLPPISAAGDGTSHVALVPTRAGGVETATFVWFPRPPGTGVSRSTTPFEPVGSLAVAYDAATSTAIGLVSELDGGSLRTHLLTARPGDATATDHASWARSVGGIAARGDGTFLVRDDAGWSLRAVSGPAAVLSSTAAPGGLGSPAVPVVVGGRYALVWAEPGLPDELLLRLFPCQ
jgi:hypothetical protein